MALPQEDAVDLTNPTKRPRNQYSNDFPVSREKAVPSVVAIQNGRNESLKGYRGKTVPKSNLPPFRPLTIIQNIDESHNSDCHGGYVSAQLSHGAIDGRAKQGHFKPKIFDKFRFQNNSNIVRGIRSQQGRGGIGGITGFHQSYTLPLTTTKEQEVEEDGYEYDVGYDNLMVEHAGMFLDSSRIQAGGKDQLESGDCIHTLSNTASIESGIAFFGQADTQSNILVEEEGLHSWDEVGGDYIILTQTQNETIASFDAYEEQILNDGNISQECVEQKLSNHGNISQGCVEEFNYPSEFDCELQTAVDFSSPFAGHEEPLHGHSDIETNPMQTVGERFSTPLERTLGYLDESSDFGGPPEKEIQPWQPRVISSGLSDEEYDDIEEDEFWKLLTEQEFYTPREIHRDDQSFQLTNVAKSDTYVKPCDTNRKTEAWEEVEHTTLDSPYSTPVSKVSKGKRKAPLPPTLISPISHISDPNPNSTTELATTPASKRMLIFPAGSPKLARITECLGFLNSLNEYVYITTELLELTLNSSGTTTKWAHLSVEQRQKPFVRPVPPKAVEERSPVDGLNAKTIMRVCFRVGEALRFANLSKSSGGTEGTDVLTELFGWC